MKKGEIVIRRPTDATQNTDMPDLVEVVRKRGTSHIGNMPYINSIKVPE